MGTEGEAPGCGTAAKQWRFEGVASSSRLDRQREKISDEALRQVAASGPVDLVVAHQEREVVVGRIEQCELQDGLLRVRGRLRAEAPGAEQLRARLERGEKLGLSLGGKVRRAHWGWDRDTEGPVRLLDEVTVEHVAVCRAQEAINPDVRVKLVEGDT
jgi:HK97 family phage prohead protease